MTGQWIIVASQLSARVFEAEGVDQGLRLVRTLRNPLGRLRNKNLQRHKPGKSQRGMGASHSRNIRHRVEPRVEPHEVAAIQFARRIARFLHDEYARTQFTQLVVAAEPHFLGKIKNEMDNVTARSVAAWIRKDFEKKTAHDILPTLRRNLKEVASRPA